MPIIKSAIKRMKQNRKRRSSRQPVKTYMKTMIKKIIDAVKAGKHDEARSMLAEAYKAIDMAAKRYIIHKNTAARKKSGLAKLVAVKQ